MRAAARNRRDRVRAMLADLKMPGALEKADDILAHMTAERSRRVRPSRSCWMPRCCATRLAVAMRSSRLPAVKTLAEFDSPSSLPSSASRSRACMLGFIERAENDPAYRKTIWRSVWRSRPPSPDGASARSRPGRLAQSEDLEPGASAAGAIQRYWWSTRSATCP